MGPESWALDMARALLKALPAITVDAYTLAYALMDYDASLEEPTTGEGGGDD